MDEEAIPLSELFAAYGPTNEAIDPAEMEVQAADAPDMWAPAIRMSDFGKRPLFPVTAYVDKFIFAGSVTLLAGAPKSGKSTLLFHLANAVSSGQPFLGIKSEQARVLYASEQSEASFREQAIKVPGLFDNERAFVVLVERNCTWNLRTSRTGTVEVDKLGNAIYDISYFDTWEKQIEFWRKLIIATHARVLVVDTFTAFARLKASDNNDPGVISTRLMELKSLFQTRPDLGIVILHHLRKPDNSNKVQRQQDETDVLGSQSYIAGVDQIVVLVEPQQNVPTAVRQLMFKGRFAPEESMQIALVKDTYMRTGV